MKKKKYKITAVIHKIIIAAAASFPELQKINTKGELMWRRTTETKTFDQCTPEEQKQLGGEKKYHPQRKGEKFRREQLAIFQGKVPLIFNHEVEMRILYEAKGPAGIEEYTDWVNAVIEKHSKTEIKKKKMSKKKKVKTMSVREYAEQLGISREAVLKKINRNRLDRGVTAQMIGNYYVITIAA